MRIDSLSYFQSSMLGMRDNQGNLSRLNQQLASGSKLLAPKDDPLAMEKVMRLTSSIATRTQFAANQIRANLALNYEATVVQEMHSALNSARDLLSISPSSSTSLRTIHAERLKSVFSHLVGLANTKDTNGDFIFGGFKTTLPTTPDTGAQPFVRTLDGGLADTYYNGTAYPDGTRSIEVENGRTVQVSDNLAEVFRFTDASFIDTANGAGANEADHDLLKNLDHAISNLPVGTLTQANLNGYVKALDQAIQKLSQVEYRIAGALGEVADVKGTTTALLLNDKNALGEIQQVDQEAAIIELQTRQTMLEASNSAYAKTANLSLFNFLS